jgi:hypothetical protein
MEAGIEPEDILDSIDDRPEAEMTLSENPKHVAPVERALFDRHSASKPRFGYIYVALVRLGSVWRGRMAIANAPIRATASTVPMAMV